MRLTDYLNPPPQILELGTDGVRSTIEALVARLRAHDVVDDPSRVTEALLEREAAHTTAMGNGVAIPHATVAGLERPHILLAVSTGNTRFGPEEMEPVRIFFLLLSPPGEAGVHIKLLARIARLVRDPDVIEALLEATDPETLRSEIERVDGAHV